MKQIMNKKLIGIIGLTVLLFLVGFNYNSKLTVILKELPFYQLDQEEINSKLQKQKEEREEIGEILTKLQMQKKDQPSMQLYARSAVLIDANNNRVLYEKNANQEMPMASTTKIMTCIIALEQGKLDDTVSISKKAESQPDVQLNVRHGEQYKLKDLLYSLMLESHNDVAVAIAEHVGGSVEGFANLMNQKAKELGLEHTNFVTPNGLDADNHQTTAVELAKIASYAIKNKEFIDIINTPNWQFSEVNNKRSFMVNNKDRFLQLMDGAIGVKTGFTSKAGFCFVGAVKKGEKTFISAVLACGWPPNKNYKWTDTTKLMKLGLNNFELKQIYDSKKVYPDAYVLGGQQTKVSLYANGDIKLLLGNEEKVTAVYDLPVVLQAPIERDTKVGTAKYYIDGELYQEIPIYVNDNVKEINLKYCFDKILSIWLW